MFGNCMNFTTMEDWGSLDFHFAHIFLYLFLQQSPSTLILVLNMEHDRSKVSSKYDWVIA